MSMVRKWSEVTSIFASTTRGSLLYKLLLKDSLAKNYPYWLGLLVYAGFAVWLAYSKPIYLYVVFVISLAFVMRFYLDTGLKKEYLDHYEQGKLTSYPIMNRIEQLSYLLFKEKMASHFDISASEAKKLIEWTQVRLKRSSMFDFFKSPIVLSAISIVLGLVTSHIKSLKLDNGDIVVIVLIFTAILWLAWILTDMFKSREKKELEVLRFLEMYAIEKERN